jgi:transposase
VLNAILYVAEQSCKWRGLPTRFGNWHSIYARMNRWARRGVLDRVFEKLQTEQIARIKIEAKLVACRREFVSMERCDAWG